MSDGLSELDLEREVARLEKRQTLLKGVFAQATRELAQLDGIGGTWAKLTGSHGKRVDDATNAATTAQSELEECKVALEIARQTLAEVRKGERVKREAAEAEAMANEVMAIQNATAAFDAPPEAVAPRPVDEGPKDPLRMRYHALSTAKVAMHQLRNAVESGLQISQDAAVHAVRSRRRRGGMFTNAHHSKYLNQADTRLEESMARLDACLKMCRIEGWEPVDPTDKSEEGLFALMDEMMAGSSHRMARDKHTALLELTGQMEMLDELLNRLYDEVAEQIEAEDAKALDEA